MHAMPRPAYPAYSMKMRSPRNASHVLLIYLR
jgi:hypothetical protein